MYYLPVVSSEILQENLIGYSYSLFQEHINELIVVKNALISKPNWSIVPNNIKQAKSLIIKFKKVQIAHVYLNCLEYIIKIDENKIIRQVYDKTKIEELINIA